MTANGSPPSRQSWYDDGRGVHAAPVVTEPNRSERTVRVWAVKRVDEDAFMFTSENEEGTRRWLARLIGYGHDVHLVTCERNTVTYLRQTEWVPAPAANDGSHAHG